MTKIIVAFSVTQQKEIETTQFRKTPAYYFYIADKEKCVVVTENSIDVRNYIPSIAFDRLSEECSDLEFYTAYAAARTLIDNAANIENLSL